jgi:hypothetical protein
VIPVTIKADPNDPWYDNTWSFRKELRIDHTKVSENMVNYPVLIDIIDNDLKANSSGNDIVFTDKTGTKLSHEVESYNSANGHLTAWVNVPSLSSTIDTSIYMYYGYPTASDQQDIAGTWNNGFKAVYHLKENWSTSAGHFKDSTANHYDGTLTDANGNSASDAGIIGPGFRFNGDVDSINIGVINTPQPITYSCWLKSNNIDDNRGALGRYYNLYFLGTWNTGPGYLRHSVDINSVRYYQHTSGVSNTWYQMDVTYDGSTVRYYIDGALVGSNSVSGSLSYTNFPWHIGDNGNGALFWNGVVDEVRIANICLSTGWISTYYRNVNSPATFYSVGTQETDSVPLNLTTSGTGVGTIEASPPPAGRPDYRIGDSVTIWANASVGSTFTGFSGNLTGTDTPQTLVIDGNENVCAEFTLNRYNLTLTTSGSGSGTIKASPAGPSYDYGTTVTIWANASTGSYFTGFTGSLTGTTTPQTLTMYGNEAVDAEFIPSNHICNLTLTTSGTGSGTNKANRSGPYHVGDEVTIWANASTGSYFTGFTGSLSGMTTPQTLTFLGDEAVDAGFDPIEYSLNLSTSGDGGGSISASLEDPYFYGDIVTITANVAVGSKFTGFSGDITGLTNPQTLIINGNKTIIAGFNRTGPYTLTLTKNGTGSGTIQASPTRASYYYGDIITIWANASVGSTFIKFTGNLTGTSAPQTYTITGNNTINAEFTHYTPGPGNWWNSQWSYRKQIIIDHTRVTENLVNFPILVNITSGDLIGHAQSDADDFVFTTDGTPIKLAHEIESYTAATGHIVAWVNMPFLSSTVDTTIFIYYGNPTASNQQNVAGTWNSGFKAIYHLKESWSTSAGHFKDSTANHYNGTLTDTNGNSASDAGIIGPGFRFNGDADSINIGVINTPQPITYSCWLKSDDVHQNKGALGRYYNLYFLGTWNAGSGVLRHSAYINSVRYYQHTSGVSNTWYLLTLTYDGSTVRYYVGGTQVGSISAPGTLTSTNYPWHIGDNGNGGLFWDGVVDEVRIANVCLSPGWISTYYGNVNNPSMFYSVGVEVTTSGLPPIISNPQPVNKSTNLDFNPLLQVHVSDPDKDFITTEVWTNASGIPQLLNHQNLNNGSGDITGISTDMVAPLTKYWWTVRCTDDGVNWSQKTYWFITGIEAPLIYDVSPANNIICAFNPRLSIYVVDYQNDLLTITFSKRVGTSWQTLGTYTGYNGRYTQNTTGMDVANQTYSWKATVSDGVHIVETPTYSFSVRAFVLKWVRPNAPSTDMGPIAADVNHDGVYEVFMLGTDTIFCVNGSTGNVIWQYYNDRIFYHSQCILADLNHDGIEEIVISCMFAESGIQPITIALHANNGTVYWIAPVSSDYRHFIIADTDGTGYPYVYVVSHYAFGYISKLRGTDGTVVARTRVYYPCHGGMSMADLDNDGKIEIILADYGATSAFLGKGIHCYDADTLKLKWYNPSTRADPQIGMLVDVTGDGVLDIVTSVYHYGGIQIINGTTGQVWKYGMSNSQYPQHSANSVYDIDGDGHLEVLGASDSPVRVYDLTSWTIEKVLPVSSQEPPLMADVIGDSRLEIITTSWAWNQGIVIYNSTYQQVGQIKRGSSRWTLVQDVDDDGQNELLFTDSNNLVCYDTSAYAPIPRVRSDQVGYSEKCNQAGVYVPPPGTPRPVLKEEYPTNRSLDVSLNPTLSIHAVEYQVHVLENYHLVEHQYDKMNLFISMSTSPNGPWQDLTSFTNVSNGVYTIPTTTMNQQATTYYWKVTATDINPQAGGITTTKTYHFTTQSPPNIDTVSTSPSPPYIQGQQVTFNATITDDVHVGETKLRITGPDGFTSENKTVYNYQWTAFTYDDFESGWGHYQSGGADCFRYQKVSETADKTTWPLVPQGSWAADIQANSGAASSFNLTAPIDVKTPGFNQIKVDFWMNSYGMGYGQKYYLEYFNGTQWIIRKTYEQNWGSFAPNVYTNTYYRFANWINFHDVVLINKTTYNFPTNMNIRFRCASSGGASQDVYIDKIYINATTQEPALYSSKEAFTVPGLYHFSFWSNDVNGNIAMSNWNDFEVSQ